MKPVDEYLRQKKCARTACTNDHDNCVHSQDGRFYCEWCAVKINRANPEVPNLVSIPRRVQGGEFVTGQVGGGGM